MKKTQFIPIALLSVSAVANAQSASRPPNIILFLVDDMGWEDTSLPFWIQKTHYNEVYETPNMERLAKGGMMFTQAYASSISSPTRCSLITGTNAARHRPTGRVMCLPCRIGIITAWLKWAGRIIRLWVLHSCRY